MVFFPPIPLIRKNYMIKKLTGSNAFSEETAKTFLEAGIVRFRKTLVKWIKLNFIDPSISAAALNMDSEAFNA